MDSVQQDQVGEILKHPPVSPLSLRERVRVRALLTLIFPLNESAQTPVIPNLELAYERYR
ncbi:hypothetical protein C1X29_24480 [Pseudomonas sp. GW456-12-10-14-LB2]|nr:hypothetical protein C1X29_24480 [Pseudomonas sp. GW456-12-10-14-LB2]